jgi:hypothetical protein
MPNTSRSDNAEDRFPFKVDVPVPVEGLRHRLELMRAWCRDNVATGAWQERSHSVPAIGEAPTRYVRFCFIDRAGAETFGRTWADPMI